jgi:heme O synthase-like polyprenyltransferase
VVQRLSKWWRHASRITWFARAMIVWAVVVFVLGVHGWAKMVLIVLLPAAFLALIVEGLWEKRRRSSRASH